VTDDCALAKAEEVCFLLVVPFEEGEDSFTVIFDPQSGLIRTMEALK
jgi:hypothetical protein